ncbi:class I SAM-dependent methyltransferase [Paenibacillus tarimensis]|uniref:class I SAM-dependent methyltransferase n=1 Tax=Paenibacillus tarimensis TaxID=416012 RepID=UPI001F3146BB|nr:class I SAM-dependent methyltransferase [Paenibacillus tarimensis]MCF2945398.1 class I SAM-dependent methyltransferase [Paenibacillus tarimensis]
MENLYLNTAALYDADNRAVFTADIPFYVERARKLGGRVLELACGTGRITIPLAEAGAEVWGLDYSPAMLEVMAAKAVELPAAIRSRLHMGQGDMTDFSLEERFNLIFIPFRSFQSLETDEQALNCLTCAREHLEPGGQFIINIFKPIRQMGDWWVDPEEHLDYETKLASGERVTRHSIKKACDTEKRLLYTDLYYRIHRQDGTVEEFKDSLRLRYFYGDDIRSLLHSAGFVIQEEYGWYDGTPAGEGPEYILVCGYAQQRV